METMGLTAYNSLKLNLEDSEHSLQDANLEHQYVLIRKLFEKGDLDSKEYMELMDMLAQLMIKRHKLFKDGLGEINKVMNQLRVAKLC
ncbi:Uncharacterised protein [Mycobacteroides abscessus subsp. abscessus]|nr:Uncharacterised protein [Mycobacteroides abscessus subsp. abscessus]